jgi:hypothetical protein
MLSWGGKHICSYPLRTNPLHRIEKKVSLLLKLWNINKCLWGGGESISRVITLTILAKCSGEDKFLSICNALSNLERMFAI